VVIVLGVMAVRTGQNVWRLYKAGDRVNEARRELAQAQTENGRLEARLKEVQSPEFVEREARERLGWGREGEVVLLLPEQKMDNGQLKIENESKPNWRKWWDLYVGI